MMPSITDVNGAGGVAARWHEYTLELTNEGWTVELWTVDAEDPDRTIPRYHLPNFPSTLTDSPGVGFCHKIWRRLNRRDPVVSCVVMTDLFSNVPIAMMCAGTGTPLVYSIHTDIAQLDGINMAPWSAAILQSVELLDAFNVTIDVPALGHAEAMATLQKLAIENAAEVQPAISAISGGIPIKKLLLVLEMSLKAPTLVDAARFTTTLQEAGLLSG